MIKGEPVIHPILEDSPNLFYIMGVLWGDGCVHRGQRMGRKDSKRNLILLYTIDEPFASTFAGALRQIGLNPHLGIREYNDGHRRNQFEVRAISKAFCSWWVEQTPQKLYSLTDIQEIIGFLRGFYESEGSLQKYWDRYWRVNFTNCHLGLIDACFVLLERLGFHPWKQTYSPRDNSVFHRIYLGRQAEVTRFLEIVKPAIKGVMS